MALEGVFLTPIYLMPSGCRVTGQSSSYELKGAKPLMDRLAWPDNSYLTDIAAFNSGRTLIIPKCDLYVIAF